MKKFAKCLTGLTIVLLLLLAIFGNRIPQAVWRPGTPTEPTGADVTGKLEIEWALDAPAAPFRFGEAEHFRPRTARTTDNPVSGPLAAAIQRGDAASVRNMLANDPELARQKEDGLPPLFLAILTDDPAMVQAFADNGADLHTAYDIDREEIHTPLSYAISRNKRKALAALLEAGADAGGLVCDKRARCGNAVSMAVLTGDPSLVRDMVVQGKISDAVLNMQGIHSQGLTVLSIPGHRVRLLPPLHTAAREGLFEVAEALIALGADLDKEDVYHRTATNHASFAKAEPILRLFAQERDRANTLVRAIAVADRKRVGELLATGTNPDTAASNGQTPLLAAIDANDPDMVRRLIASGADPAREMRGRTPLRAAVATRNAKVVRDLLAAGADPDERLDETMPAFAAAVLSDDAAIVGAFLDAGASLTTRYKVRGGGVHNILSYAVVAGKPVAAVLLARAGADLDWLACTQSFVCGNVLTLAATSADTRLLRDLLEARKVSDRQVNLVGVPKGTWRNLVAYHAPEQQPRLLLLPPLHAAARAGRIDAIRLLVDKGANAHHPDTAGKTALAYAANPEIAALLETIVRSTPTFEAAIAAGDATLVRRYLDNGANPNTPLPESRMPPLFVAVDSDDLAVIRILLDAGARIDAVYQDGSGVVLTSLGYAALKAKRETAMNLLRAGANPARPECSGTSCGNTLTLAAGSDDPDLIFEIVKERGHGKQLLNLYKIDNRFFWTDPYDGSTIDRSVTLVSPLHVAIRRGDVDLSRRLRDLGAVDKVRNLAVESTLPRAYSSEGADAAVSALVAAAKRGDAQEIARLLSEGANPNIATRNGDAALPAAAEAGHLAVVRLLLAAGVNPTRPAYSSSPQPIHLAIRNGHTEIVWALVEAGVDPHAARTGNRNTMTDAIETGRTEIALGLIERGADLSYEYCPGEVGCVSYLVLAAKYGNAALVRKFIESGIPINPPDAQIRAAQYLSGTTPLMAAAQNGSSEAIKILLNAGATVDIRNGAGCSALDYALIAQEPAAAELLRAAGGTADETRCGMLASLMRLR